MPGSSELFISTCWGKRYLLICENLSSDEWACSATEQEQDPQKSGPEIIFSVIKKETKVTTLRSWNSLCDLEERRLPGPLSLIGQRIDNIVQLWQTFQAAGILWRPKKQYVFMLLSGIINYTG
jgi:hypothetical protein